MSCKTELSEINLVLSYMIGLECRQTTGEGMKAYEKAENFTKFFRVQNRQRVVGNEFINYRLPWKQQTKITNMWKVKESSVSC